MGGSYRDIAGLKINRLIQEDKMKSLQSDLCGKDLIAFGTGPAGGRLIRYLIYATYHYHLIGAANSRIEIGKEENFQDTSLLVRNIEDWYKLVPDAFILITTSDEHHQEIADLCKAVGYKNIIPITEEYRNILQLEALVPCLENLGVSIEKSFIQLKNMKFINPFELNYQDKVLFLGQLADIVFPSLSEWRFIDEGPYNRSDGELSPNDIVLDCGANKGIFSAYAAAHGCCCYAFEPTHELIPYLKRHSEFYKNKIVPVEAAVTDHVGTAVLHVRPLRYDCNSLLDRFDDATGEVEVQTTTIDRFVLEHRFAHVDFIKADIEGAERNMLVGAQETLAKFAPRLSICTYHQPDDREVLTKLILKANPRYHIEYQWKKLYAYLPERLE